MVEISYSYRINRNIMECKDSFDSCLCISWQCINRNIMECKGKNALITLRLSRLVLIETLWNVKTNSPALTISEISVLIETLWNVKLSAENAIPDSLPY